MLDKFTVIDLIKTRSNSVCTIAPNYMKFNTQTAQELGYPSHVQFLVDGKGKQFAIRICKPEDPNAMPFSKPEGQQRYPIRITNATVLSTLRKLAEWTDDTTWNVPGVYFADEDALVYSLESAYLPKAKGGWPAKREREAAEARAMQSPSDNGLGDDDRYDEEETTD